MSIRVLLVDDHQIVREGLRALFERAPGIEIAGDAADGRAALALVKSLCPDVVVMDVGMRDLNGIETTRQIKAANERVKVVGLSAHSDKRYVLHMLDAGASGYVLKITAHDELVRAVRAVHAGMIYLCPEIAGHVVARGKLAANGGEPSAYSVLGARERQVLQLVAEGKSSGEAARAMDISVKTVEAHRRNIAEKLGLHGTAELTKYAVREGLTSLDE